MALSTDDPTLATATEQAPTRGPVTDPSRPSHGRRNAVLGWTAVGIAVAAVAALAIAVLRPEPSPPVHANRESQVVAEHGSINAIEHRDELKLAARANSESRVVAEHGSINAIEHRDQPDDGAPTASNGG
jgi:hypothetical protein